MRILPFLHIKPKHLAIGSRGERIALRFYRKHGYHLLEKNYVSGHYEIDLILEAPDRSTIVISEVKTRSSGSWLSPIESVDRKKQFYLRKAAENYLNMAKIKDMSVRFDIVGVYPDESWRVEHYPNAF